MSEVKKQHWTEDDVIALPLGEHDFFERKSGQLFDDTGELLATLAKAVSAFANSGGGHIVLGVTDAGKIDGVPRLKGSTHVREWLEQKLPRLVDYPLSDFRVHAVSPGPKSTIPLERELIVVDVGDSALAPHQSVRGGRDVQKHVYYHRQGGHSVAAPHFYLELLRQRLVGPMLDCEVLPVRFGKVVRNGSEVFVIVWLRFRITNSGRVAAYKWEVRLTSVETGSLGDEAQKLFDNLGRGRPEGFGMDRGIRMDDTILPGGSLVEEIDWGVYLRVSADAPSVALVEEATRVISPVGLHFRVASEVSPGEDRLLHVDQVVDVGELATYIANALR